MRRHVGRSLLLKTAAPCCPACAPLLPPAELQAEAASAKEQATAAEAALAALHQQAEELRQQLDAAAAEAAQQAGAVAAVQAERDMLLTDQQQLMLAVAEQQAALAVELALQGADSCAAEGAPPPPPSPSRPRLDVIGMLRGQKEALRAQHEASMAVRRAWAAGGRGAGAASTVLARCWTRLLVGRQPMPACPLPPAFTLPLCRAWPARCRR